MTPLILCPPPSALYPASLCIVPDHARFNSRSPFEKGQGTRAVQRSSTHRSRGKVYCSSAQNCCVRLLYLFCRAICTSPTPAKPVLDPSIAFLARPSPGIGPSAPSPPSPPPHPFPPEGHTRHPHQALPLLTTRTQTRTSFLVGSRYPFLPTQAPDPTRSSTTRTPIPSRCAIIKNLTPWSNAVNHTTLRVPPSYLAHNNILLSARMRSSASCSIIEKMIPFVSRI